VTPPSGNLKLNLSQPLDIALALLLLFSDINVADNPHFYVSLGEELGKRVIQQWIREPLKYGEPLKEILKGSGQAYFPFAIGGLTLRRNFSQGLYL